jgi:pyruvate/2-oxoacid:ferredoxin oxidoreductase alpha subunit
MLASGSVQEAHDFAAIGQRATLKSRVPVLHYFDGGYCGPEAYKPREMVFSKENHEISLNPGGRGSLNFWVYGGPGH